MKTKQELLEGLSELFSDIGVFSDVGSKKAKPVTPNELNWILRKFLQKYDLWPHAPRVLPVVTMGKKPGEMNVSFIDSFSDQQIKTIDDLWIKLTS